MRRVFASIDAGEGFQRIGSWDQKNARSHVLIIDPNEKQSVLLASWLEEIGFSVLYASSAEEGWNQCQCNDSIEFVFCEFSLPGQRGISFLRRIKKSFPAMAVVLMGKGMAGHLAATAMKAGALDCISKPIRKQRVRMLFKNTVLQQSPSIKKEHIEVALQQFHWSTLVQMKRAAASSSHVLLIGESGIEMDVAAKWIHDHSLQSRMPFEQLRDPSLMNDWVELALFGCGKSFLSNPPFETMGKIEQGKDGSLFIEDITRLSNQVFSSLVSMMDQKHYYRLGEVSKQPLRTRMFIAMRQPKDIGSIQAMDKMILFLEKLGVDVIRFLPVRHRKDNLIGLALSILQDFAKKHQKNVHQMSAQVKKCLLLYDWPGNDQELKDVIAYAVHQCGLEELQIQHLPVYLFSTSFVNTGDFSIPKDASLRQVEQSWILHIIKRCGGNKTQAAAALGISRRALYDKLALLG